MDRLWIKDLQVGQAAEGIFEVSRKQQATGKNGRTFLKLLLQDKTGQLDARVWNEVEELNARFEAGDRIKIQGQVGSFQGRPQLTIEQLEKVVAELDPADFAFEAPKKQAEERRPTSVSEGIEALREELTKVSDPNVRALLLSFVDDSDISSKLRRAPAAKEVHHAYPGGLLEHLLSCVRLADRLADHYPMADRDLLIAGAFLHDLGKVVELSHEKGVTTYTDEGNLVGHLMITASWIRERAKEISGFPKELELHLIHLVLAHHGRLEYGSPKVPMTLEAFLVHQLDVIDSRVNSILGQMARSPGGGKWSSPQKSYEGFWWKAPAPTEGGRKRGSPARGHGKRRSDRAERRERREAAATAQAEQPRRERAPKERPARAQGAAPEARQAAPAQSEKAAQGREERRGPKILKRADGAPRSPTGEKLTFKPFSAFTGEEEERAPAVQAPTTTEAELAPPAGETPPAAIAVDTALEVKQQEAKAAEEEAAEQKPVATAEAAAAPAEQKPEATAEAAAAPAEQKPEATAEAAAAPAEQKPEATPAGGEEPEQS